MNKNKENFPWGFRWNRVFKYFTEVKIDIDFIMASSYLTFDLDMTLIDIYAVCTKS